MTILPAIDLKDGRCVRLSQGRRSDVRIYDADPVETAKAFASAGAKMIHVVDLDGAFKGVESANRAIVEKIIDKVKVKNPKAPAVKREAEEDWGKSKKRQRSERN